MAGLVVLNYLLLTLTTPDVADSVATISPVLVDNLATSPGVLVDNVATMIGAYHQYILNPEFTGIASVLEQGASRLRELTLQGDFSLPSLEQAWLQELNDNVGNYVHMERLQALRGALYNIISRTQEGPINHPELAANFARVRSIAEASMGLIDNLTAKYLIFSHHLGNYTLEVVNALPRY